MEVRKFDVIDDKSNDKVVHDLTLWKANGFTVEPLDASAEGEVFALNALCVSFADVVIVRR